SQGSADRRSWPARSGSKPGRCPRSGRTVRGLRHGRLPRGANPLKLLLAELIRRCLHGVVNHLRFGRKAVRTPTRTIPSNNALETVAPCAIAFAPTLRGECRSPEERGPPPPRVRGRPPTSAPLLTPGHKRRTSAGALGRPVDNRRPARLTRLPCAYFHKDW